jgi:DNA repair photolyase
MHRFFISDIVWYYLCMEYSEFEKNGLKIDKERVLTYSKLICPLNCTYCFVDEMSQEQAKSVSYLSNEQVRLLQNLPEQVKLIMLGCDTEFFQNKKDALGVLNKLKTLNKDISVITKLPLSKEYLEEILLVAKEVESNGNIFSFSVSIPCFSDESLNKYEPGVPSPLRRIETLKNAAESGISTMLAIRPLLPDVDNSELESIIELTKAFVIGYYSGPLYLKQDKINLLLPGFKSEEEKKPHWMLEGNTYQEITRDGQMEYLVSLVKKSGKQFFEGAAEGVNYARSIKKYDQPRN